MLEPGLGGRLIPTERARPMRGPFSEFLEPIQADLMQDQPDKVWVCALLRVAP